MVGPAPLPGAGDPSYPVAGCTWDSVSEVPEPRLTLRASGLFGPDLRPGTSAMSPSTCRWGSQGWLCRSCAWESVEDNRDVTGQKEVRAGR